MSFTDIQRTLNRHEQLAASMAQQWNELQQLLTTGWTIVSDSCIKRADFDWRLEYYHRADDGKSWVLGGVAGREDPFEGTTPFETLRLAEQCVTSTLATLTRENIVLRSLLAHGAPTPQGPSATKAAAP